MCVGFIKSLEYLLNELVLLNRKFLLPSSIYLKSIFLCFPFITFIKWSHIQLFVLHDKLEELTNMVQWLKKEVKDAIRSNEFNNGHSQFESIEPIADFY